jgi:hypothetical protein
MLRLRAGPVPENQRCEVQQILCRRCRRGRRFKLRAGGGDRKYLPHRLAKPICNVPIRAQNSTRRPFEIGPGPSTSPAASQVVGWYEYRTPIVLDFRSETEVNARVENRHGAFIKSDSVCRMSGCVGARRKKKISIRPRSALGDITATFLPELNTGTAQIDSTQGPDRASGVLQQHPKVGTADAVRKGVEIVEDL